MLRATSSGIVSHRSCSLRCAGSRCQRWMLSCQFIGHRCKPPFQSAQPARWDRRRDRTGDLHDKWPPAACAKTPRYGLPLIFILRSGRRGGSSGAAGKDEPKMSRGSCRWASRGEMASPETFKINWCRRYTRTAGATLLRSPDALCHIRRHPCDQIYSLAWQQSFDFVNEQRDPQLAFYRGKLRAEKLQFRLDSH